MKISAYLWSVAAENMFFPYKASIESILSLVDEVVIAIDPNLENASIYTQLSNKVRIIKCKYDVLSWDIRNQMLQAARAECIGDWCLYWQLCGVLHEKDAELIETTLDNTSATYVPLGQISVWGMRRYGVSRVGLPWLTRNLSNFQHHTPSYHIGSMDSIVYDGKYIIDGDDAILCDITVDSWFANSPSCLADISLLAPDTKTLGENPEKYSSIYYYTFYNWNRKTAQGEIDRIYHDRVYGRCSDLDAEKYYLGLKQPLVFTNEFETPMPQAQWYFNLNHPKYIRDWLNTYGIREPE
jgi:hypothetical protein